MEKCWKNIYKWPDRKVLEGTGFLGLFGYVTSFRWKEDPGSTYFHIFGNFYYKGKRD